MMWTAQRQWRHDHTSTTGRAKTAHNRPVHLKLHHPERRSPAGLRSESPAILSLHTWLCVLSQIHIYYQICWWYCGSGPHFQQWWDRILGWGGETNIMVPGQLSLSEREQNQRADCGLQKETPAALHSSYDQWDPCGESKQLQVPRRKHLRGPDLDYTHPNTGQESQAKTVPSATAEKIQGLTNNPENFLCRDHRKCFVSVHLSVVWKQLQPRLQSLAESCALSWAYLWVGSPLSAGHLHQTMQRQSWQNHQRLKSPW